MKYFGMPLGMYDIVPAMCQLDYTMSEAGGAADFVREYTLASGGLYWDCGYHKLNRMIPRKRLGLFDCQK